MLPGFILKINKKYEMILAAAQTKPTRGDIEANLSDHYRLIELAVQNGAQLIAFPEMSITRL